MEPGPCEQRFEAGNAPRRILRWFHWKGFGSEGGGGGPGTEALLARFFRLGLSLGAAIQQAGSGRTGFRWDLGRGGRSAQLWGPGSGRLAATFQKEYEGKNQIHVMYAKFFILH